MFYLLNKSKGITSFKAIKDFAKQNNISKIGHTGTLDPLASGLLLIATDEDTKLIEFVDKGFKTYVATMKIGLVSDTYDVDGEIVETNIEIPNKEVIFDSLLKFEGKSMQTPPSFSAKKINGQKAYDLAREGKAVNLKSVEVEIKDICNFKYHADNSYSFEVTVSRGTYIRSIIHDLGQKLQCGAIMTDLVRTAIGRHTLEEAGNEINVLDLLAIETFEYPQMKRVFHGLESDVKHKDGIFALKYKNDIFGVVEIKGSVMKPTKLLGNKFKKAGF